MFPYFDNESGHIAFGHVRTAWERLGMTARRGATLEFAGVVVTDRASLARAISEGLARRPAAIVAPSSEVLLEALRQTHAVPIVFVTHQDPVELNVTSSLADPPSNITGISFHIGVEGKMLELLRETAGRAKRFGYVVDKEQAERPAVRDFMEASARRHGIQWKLVAVESIDTLDADLHEAGEVEGWLVTKVTALDLHRAAFIAIVARTGHPSIYPSLFDVQAGAPMAYEAQFDDVASAVVRQLDRVLSGVSPRDIPIERPKRFRLSLNLAAARGSGMQLTPQLISRADKVL